MECGNASCRSVIRMGKRRLASPYSRSTRPQFEVVRDALRHQRDAARGHDPRSDGEETRREVIYGVRQRKLPLCDPDERAATGVAALQINGTLPAATIRDLMAKKHA